MGSPLGFLVTVIKEFKNRFKWKLYDQFITLEEPPLPRPQGKQTENLSSLRDGETKSLSQSEGQTQSEQAVTWQLGKI